MKITIQFGLLFVLALLTTMGQPTKVFAQQQWRITGNSGTDPTTNFLGTTDTEDLVIRTDDTERVRVNSRGRVGIGTDDPFQLLHVEIEDHVTDSVSYPARISHLTSGTPETGFGTGLEFQVGGTGGSDSIVGAIESILTDATVGAEGSALLFKSTDVGDDGLATRMSIHKDGNVAMGGPSLSSSQPAKLTVTADIERPILSLKKQSEDSAFISTAVSVNRNGLVAIGSHVPSAPLHVVGPSSNDTETTTVKIRSGFRMLFLDGSGIDARLAFNEQVSRDLHLNRLSSGDVALAGGGGDIIANGGGNVGIGVQNPNNRLSVSDLNHQIAIVDSNNDNKTWTLTSHQATSGVGLWEDGDQGRFVVTSGGNVGIGTQSPGNFRLAVNGSIRSKEIVVETGWSDYVFDKDYDLKSLKEVESFIRSNGHLPDVPSASDIAENGVPLGRMQSTLLLKVEELTLYLIDIENILNRVQNENQQLRNSLAVLQDSRTISR